MPDFLRGCGVACPPSVNLADVVVDLTHTKEADADADGAEQSVDLVARFAASALRPRCVHCVHAVTRRSNERRRKTP